MTALTLALWTLGVAAIAFALGWSTRDRQKQRRADELSELKMLLRAHVEHETVEG